MLNRLDMAQFRKQRPHAVVSVIAASMLLIAAARLPYGYYTILRLVVCGVSIYNVAIFFKSSNSWISWPFGAIAVLFNPLIPVYLSREIWRPIDVILAAWFLIVGLGFQSSGSENR